MREVLRTATGPVDLCDSDGNLLGSFLPALSPEKRQRAEPHFSDEQLRQMEEEGGECTTEELIRSLERFPCSLY